MEDCGTKTGAKRELDVVGAVVGEQALLRRQARRLDGSIEQFQAGTIFAYAIVARENNAVARKEPI